MITRFLNHEPLRFTVHVLLPIGMFILPSLPFSLFKEEEEEEEYILNDHTGSV